MKQRPATSRNTKGTDKRPLGERDWLNLSETAELFAMHRTTLYRHVKKGTIPGSAIGRFGTSLRFKRVEIERWVTQRDTDAAA